jgi:outer membrane protein assembly factor BamB
VLIGDQTGTLYAIDARSGALRTSSTAAGPISGSPAVGDPDQSAPHLFLGDGGGNIYAIDQTDDLPAPTWRATLGGPVDGPPALANGVLYAATDPAVGDPHISALDAATGRPLVDAALPGAAAAPIVADGRLVVATRSGDLLAYERPDS